MGNMHLVTGYAGQEHITASDQGAFNAALIGRDQFVLDVGNALEAQVISNNQIRILDGDLMMQGRFVRLDPGTYVDLAIENGAQGVKRNDLIVARYTKNTVTGVEAVDLVVIKGTAVESNPADPAHTEGDITNGAAVHDFPLWRIPLDGLNVGEPVALFGEPFMDSMRTLPEMRKTVNKIYSEVDIMVNSMFAAIEIPPVGSVFWYTGKTAPTDYLICDGSAVLIADYPKLYEVLGSTFGTTTATEFYLPNLQATFIRGAGTQDGYSATFAQKQDATAFSNYSTTTKYVSGADKTSGTTYLSTPESLAGGGNSGNRYVRPYNIALTPIIKY